MQRVRSLIDAALKRLDRRPGKRRLTIGADNGYDQHRFVQGVRQQPMLRGLDRVTDQSKLVLASYKPDADDCIGSRMSTLREQAVSEIQDLNDFRPVI